MNNARRSPLATEIVAKYRQPREEGEWLDETTRSC